MAWEGQSPLISACAETVSRDRRHGDPFPLPLQAMNSVDPEPGIQLRLQLMNEAVKSVNGIGRLNDEFAQVSEALTWLLVTHLCAASGLEGHGGESFKVRLLSTRNEGGGCLEGN